MSQEIYQARFNAEGEDFRPIAPMRVDDPIPTQRLNSGLFSSLTPEWPTPAGVFAALDERFHFTLDACATPQNAKCARFFTPQQDALRQEWSGSVFLNPPYGREIGAWLRKAWESSKRGAIVVCLVPCRTDTSWWHDYCMKGEILFVRGRLKFGAAENSAPFPSAVVIFEAAQSDRH